MCSRHLVAVCVRLFLERREAAMQQFAAQFKDFNLVHDEKVRARDFLIARSEGQRSCIFTFEWGVSNSKTMSAAVV